MNRDAKIGVVVILLIVVVLVIIWGNDRGDDPAERDMTLAKNENTDTGPPANSIDMRPSGGGSSLEGGVRAVSPENGIRVVPSSDIAVRPPEGAVTITTPEDPVVPPPAPKPKKWSYTVAASDTLIAIARGQLGDPERWPEIAKLNNLVKPYAIHVGQKLSMPPKGTGTEAVVTVEPTPAVSVTPGKGRKYTVQNGDSLTLIAREQLNDGMLWKKIAEINKLAKPYRLRAGQVLLLPE